MKTHFVCQQCGAFSQKWVGRCPACRAYDSMVEEEISAKKSRSVRPARKAPVPLASVAASSDDRRLVGIHEVDRVLGGGLVRGSVILLGGDPGIGKSTLMLQIADHVTRKGRPVFYASGEESSYQVRMRAERLGIAGRDIIFLPETELETIIDEAAKAKPGLMIIDSIQTVYKTTLASAPGSVGQVRECGNDLMKYAKDQGVTTVLIGHVTKFGAIAGPKTLEHIVDTVLYFEGEKEQQYRILRAIKNRFGSTNEIGVFEMTAAGLVPVENPTSIFLTGSRASGSVIVTALEGSRPLLIELQALTNPANFNYPQKVATGIDTRRLNMLMAVLERRVGVTTSGLDCFINIVGGIKVCETSTDLGIILAIASSIRNKPVDGGSVVIGEVGLAGEVRPVWGLDARLKEAAKLGLKTAIVPAKNSLISNPGLNIETVSEAREAVNKFIG